MIEISQRFVVPAPPDEVWAVLADPHAVVECIPGAALDEDLGDGGYRGSLSVRFGPLRVRFTGSVTLELDEAERAGQITGQGRDAQGGTKDISAEVIVSGKTGHQRTQKKAAAR